MGGISRTALSDDERGGAKSTSRQKFYENGFGAMTRFQRSAGAMGIE